MRAGVEKPPIFAYRPKTQVIHRLDKAVFKQRKISRQLDISRLTVKKYLENPNKSRVKSSGRPSKLDAYRDLIK